MEEDKLNSNTPFTLKNILYKSLTIGNSGYVSLKTESISLEKVLFATVYTYQKITPIAAINVYASSGSAFLFGTPGTVVTNIGIRFYYSK